MQLFELVSPRLFRPLAGPNRAFYAELLLLLWEECRHTADYSISRAEAVSRAEDYFAALAKPLTLAGLSALLFTLAYRPSVLRVTTSKNSQFRTTL